MSHLGIVSPSPYNLFELAGFPQAAIPYSYALRALPGRPLYDLSPLERPQVPNSYNHAIYEEWKAWRQAAQEGAPGSGKTPSGSSGSSGSGGSSGSSTTTTGAGNSIFTAYANNPVDTMPDTGQPLHIADGIPTPAPGATDVEVVSFIVPDNWFAIVKAVSNQYLNNSFQEGSGDLIWRVDVDGVYPPGFNNVRTSLGSVQHPRSLQGALIARGGQKVRYTVSVDAGATIPTGNTVYTVCSFDGYLVPAL